MRRRAFKLIVVVGTCGVLAAAVAFAEIMAREQTNLDGNQVAWQETRELVGLAPYVMYGCAPYDASCLEKSPYFGDRPEADWREALDVVVLGGSTAAGAMASGYDTTFFRVWADLTESNVVSAGVPGYVSAQEAIALALQVVGRKPGSVVLVSGFNDVVMAPLGRIPPGYPSNWPFIEELKRSPSAPLLAWLGTKSGLVNLLVQRRVARHTAALAQDASAPVALDAVDLQRRLDIWEWNVSAMAHLCRGADIAFTFVVQPNGYMSGSQFAHYPWSAAEAAYTERVWPQFAERAAETCRRHGVSFLDATTIVPATNFGDPAHFDDAGHRVLGVYLAQHVGRAAAAD